ncbi:MAG: hypothetical protein ACRDPA_32475 [Solirubrobacteraceae bacterium]
MTNQATYGARGNGASGESRLPSATLSEARPALAAPFPGACIGYLPNRLGPNSQWAAVFPYVDVTAIQDRLDLVVGPERWSHELAAVDQTTLACQLRLYDVSHTEIGQGSDRWSQSANAFKRCARHFGVGRYLTQLPPIRLKLGTGIPVNGKGRPYITDELLAQLRAGYEQQVQALAERFGPILPHPGVGAGENEGETLVHPEVEEAAGTEPAAAEGEQSNPHGARLRATASARKIGDAELGNLIRDAVGQGAIPADRASRALPAMLDWITEEISGRTIELIDMFYPAAGPGPADAPAEATRVDFGALEPPQAA